MVRISVVSLCVVAASALIASGCGSSENSASTSAQATTAPSECSTAVNAAFTASAAQVQAYDQGDLDATTVGKEVQATQTAMSNVLTVCPDVNAVREAVLTYLNRSRREAGEKGPTLQEVYDSVSAICAGADPDTVNKICVDHQKG